MRIVPIALVIALSPSLALAQSSTATTGITKPTTTAPASNTKISEPKSNIPPAARSGEKGIRAGEGAMDARSRGGQAPEVTGRKKGGREAALFI